MMKLEIRMVMMINDKPSNEISGLFFKLGAERQRRRRLEPGGGSWRWGEESKD